MNKTLRDSLPSEWIKYVVVVILSVVLWLWVFGLYHAPKDAEKIEFFFAGEVTDYTFEKEAAAVFDDIKKVEISAADPSLGVAFNQKYSVVALSVSDVVVVPESIAKETECKRAFVVIEGVGEPFVQEEVSYGVYLSDEAMARLGKYFKFKEERYVAFAPAASVNAGRETDHSIKFIEWLAR